MSRKPYRKSQVSQVAPEEVTPPPELEQILCNLKSPDAQTRADAVRRLCPCRGTQWEVAVFPHVLELRNDPSPIVRHAVEHDLTENRWWGERPEQRRLEGRRTRRETERVREEIEVGLDDGKTPPPHSQAWRMHRRPRRRKWHYPRNR
jgi:hypothetical protein